MIKPNELRIGNWVKAPATYDKTPQDYKSVFQIKGIKLGAIYVEREKETDYIEIHKIEPIALTEEWLLKFGFKNRSGIWQNSSEFSLEYGESNYDIGKGWRYGFFSFKIKSVHQLQNLYFALSGKELILKSKISVEKQSQY